MKRLSDFPRQLGQFLEDLFGHSGEGLGVILFTAIGVLLIENAVNLYQDWAAGTPIGVDRLLTNVLVPLVIAATVWAILQRRRRGVDVITDEETILPHRGLIWLLGPNRDAVEVIVGAVRHHQPVLSDIWLIGMFNSPDVAACYEDAVQRVAAAGLDVTWHKVPIERSTIRQTHLAVKRIYTELLPRSFVANDVVADLTGANKLMTTGLATACVNNGWPLSYAERPWDPRTRQPDRGQPVRYLALKVNFLRPGQDEPTPPNEGEPAG